MRSTEKAILMNMCMIYDNHGNVLVQDRAKPDWPGLTFPGGHVEKNEPLTDAVIREVFEETGLTVSNVQLCGVKEWIENDIRSIVLLYKTNSFTGNLKSSPEGKVYWEKLDNLKKLMLADTMDSLLDIFTNPNLSEQYFYKTDKMWNFILK